MTAYGTEFFSMNDVNRLRILQDVIDRRLTTRLAASRLEISDRHCRRLLERYCEHGPLYLVNRRRGQPGNRQLMPGLAERALRIIRERKRDCCVYQQGTLCRSSRAPDFILPCPRD